MAHAACRALLSKGLKVKEHQLPQDAHCCWDLGMVLQVKASAGVCSTLHGGAFNTRTRPRTHTRTGVQMHVCT